MSGFDAYLEIKRDIHLTCHEVNEILRLYIISFLDNQELDQSQYDFLRKTVSETESCVWFLLKDKNNNTVIGMVSLFINYEHAHLFDINIALGENICNLSVHPEYRGFKCAKYLMNELVDYCQGIQEFIGVPLVLEIKKNSNHVEQLFGLYSGLGFEVFEETGSGFFLKK